MWLTVISVFVLVVLDQASKVWAVQVLQPAGTLPFLPGVMQLTFALNDGAAFSLLAGRQGLLIVVTSVALAGMLAFVLLGGASNGWVRWGLVLIIGGGASNLLDRLLNRVVVDYFDVTFMNYAIFNLADCFVTVGCVLLFIGILFGERMARRKGAGKKGRPAEKQNAPQPALTQPAAAADKVGTVPTDRAGQKASARRPASATDEAERAARSLQALQRSAGRRGQTAPADAPRPENARRAAARSAYTAVARTTQQDGEKRP